jgi:predicted MFS family arabinose efflux permease
MAIHNLVLNFGILAGSLSGPLLVEWLGIREMLWLSAGLRFLAAIIFWFLA